MKSKYYETKLGKTTDVKIRCPKGITSALYPSVGLPVILTYSIYLSPRSKSLLIKGCRFFASIKLGILGSLN